jgi:hypothetical protein
MRKEQKRNKDGSVMGERFELNPGVSSLMMTIIVAYLVGIFSKIHSSNLLFP